MLRNYNCIKFGQVRLAIEQKILANTIFAFLGRAFRNSEFSCYRSSQNLKSRKSEFQSEGQQRGSTFKQIITMSLRTIKNNFFREDMKWLPNIEFHFRHGQAMITNAPNVVIRFQIHCNSIFSYDIFSPPKFSDPESFRMFTYLTYFPKNAEKIRRMVQDKHSDMIILYQIQY